MLRILAAALGTLFLVITGLQLLQGQLEGPMLLTFLGGIAFLLYGIGGSVLLEKLGLGDLNKPVGTDKVTSKITGMLGTKQEEEVTDPAETPGDDIKNHPVVIVSDGVASRRRLHRQQMEEFHQNLATLTPRAFLTPAILAINCIVFAAMLISGVDVLAPRILDLLGWGANFAPKTTGGQWWRLITANYLHIGIAHIAFNMWVFWNIGALVERLLGNVGFFLVYTISGVLGSFATILWNPGVVSAGASGAIFGIYGCLLGLLAFAHDSIPRPVLKSLGKSALLFVGINVLYGLGQKNIDMAAHIGGLAAGFVAGLLLRRPLNSSVSVNQGRRNLIVGIVGFLAIGAGVGVTKDGYADLQQKLIQFGEIEKRVISRLRQSGQEYQTGALSREEFATVLKRDAIRPWEKAMQEFENVPNLSKQQLELHGKFVKFMRLRLEGWQLSVEGLEKGAVLGMPKILQAAVKQKEAERVLKELKKPNQR